MKKRAGNRRNEEAVVDLTPMIDVVFQLIIFFIVTITISKDLNRDILLEQAPRGPEIAGEDPRTFTIEVDQRGWISLNNAQVSREKLREIVQRRYNRYGQFPVMIRGDYRTAHRDIRAVMDLCSEIGIWRVSFVAIKEKKT